MLKEQYKELLEQVASKSEPLLELLDEVKNQIADARNGDYSTEARKVACTLIDDVLYNKIKNLSNPQKEKKDKDTWI